ncbi:hypothetical protein KKA15_03650 [Patescibacteria group bacterium]|nr:hypothetical protein [Patescibacteria group bacterium]
MNNKNKKLKNKEYKVEYVYNPSLDVEKKLFRALSMLINEEDLYATTYKANKRRH